MSNGGRWDWGLSLRINKYNFRYLEGPVLKYAEAWRQRLLAPSSFAGSQTKLA